MENRCRRTCPEHCLRIFDRSDYARRAVYFHERSILPQSRRVFDARDTGNAILSRYKCAVLERAANFQNDAAGIHKKRRPSGIGRSRNEDLAFEQGLFVCRMQYLYAPADISGRDAGADVFTFLQWRNCRPRDKPTRIDNGRRLLYAREPFEEDGILARELSQIHRVVALTCVKLFDGQVEYLLDRSESFCCHQRLRPREDLLPKYGHYVNKIFFVRFPVTTECFEQQVVFCKLLSHTRIPSVYLLEQGLERSSALAPPPLECFLRVLASRI